MACLFNPAQLTEKVEVHWNRLSIPGLSHQKLQYQSTGNRAIQGVEFHLDQRLQGELHAHLDVLAFREFIRGLTYPPAESSGPGHRSPPRTLIVWPRVLTVETVVTDVEFRYDHLAVDGQVLVYTAVVGFEEILDVHRAVQEED